MSWRGLSNGVRFLGQDLLPKCGRFQIGPIRKINVRHGMTRLVAAPTECAWLDLFSPQQRIGGNRPQGFVRAFRGHGYRIAVTQREQCLRNLLNATHVGMIDLDLTHHILSRPHGLIRARQTRIPIINSGFLRGRGRGPVGQ
jgi:hypothetical protein